MSDQTTTPEVVDENGDELIHVPKGQSRLRYLATIGLVLFLLIIFVVADLFSSTLTGGGRGSDDVYLTWEDPVDGSSHEVKRSKFFDTARTLQMMSAFGVYMPDSYQFADPANRPASADTEDEDTASFFIYEDLATDMGVAISDKEHKDFLRGRFGGPEGLDFARQRSGKSFQEFSKVIRRIQRVQKLRGMMLATVSMPDLDGLVSKWAADNPQFKYQIVTVKSEDYVATAEAEVPADEELTTYFRDMSPGQQQRYYTEEKSVAELAFLALAEGEAATTLLEAYPAVEGTDVDAEANSYYSQFRVARFTVEVEKEASDAPAEDDTEGADDDSADDSAEPQETPVDEKPVTRIQDFEEVEEQVRREAPIHAAMGAFLTDIQDRLNSDETVDLAAEAAALGLTYETTSEEGTTRQEFLDMDTWGNSGQLASELTFGQEGRFMPRVIVTDKGMVIGRVTSKIPRQEPAFEDIRDQIAELWVEERSKELAVETLENMREVLAEKPEGTEAADWKPVVDGAAFKTLVAEAGYSFYERPWLGRGELPEGQTFQTASKANQYMMFTPTVYELEEGQLGPAAASGDGSEAYLIRFDGKRDKDEGGLTYQELLQLRSPALYEKTREFGAKVFMGDGEWLAERAKVRFPAREKEEAERAARDDAESA